MAKSIKPKSIKQKSKTSKSIKPKSIKPKSIKPKSKTPKCPMESEYSKNSEPKPKSITHRLTDDGISGLVLQVFDRLNHTEDPSVPIGKLPCPWFAAFLTCKAASNDKCNKCKNENIWMYSFSR